MIKFSFTYTLKLFKRFTRYNNDVENNFRIEKETKNNETEELFEPIYKITHIINESNLKQILDESTVIYVKKEIQKFKETTNNIIEKRKKLEEQNILLETEERDLQHSTEKFTSSLELKTQLITTLTQQSVSNQNELTLLCNKCTNTVTSMQKKYEDIKEKFQNNSLLYLEHKNAQIASLKAEIQTKISQKKYSDLKKQHKLRLSINRQLFNQDIIKFVQAIVDYRKRTLKTVEVNNRGKENIKGNNLGHNDVKRKSNILLDLETLSSSLKFLPQSLSNSFKAPSTTYNYNYDKVALEIQARSEQRQKEWKQQLQFPFSLKKHSSCLENKHILKISKDNFIPKTISVSEIPTTMIEGKKETVSAHFDQKHSDNDQHVFSSYQQVPSNLPEQSKQNTNQVSMGKRTAATNDLPKNKKINIIDVQTIPCLTEKEQMITPGFNSNDFRYLMPLVQTTEEKKLSQNSISDPTLPAFSQQEKSNTNIINQEACNFEPPSIHNTTKPDLIVSPFFNTHKPSDIEKNRETKNFPEFSIQNLLSSYVTETDAESGSLYDGYMNSLSPMSASIDNEVNTNNVCIPTQSQYCFNFGQQNTTQPNIVFGKTTSNLFNMFK